jgi:hypothetical protein
MFLKGHYEFKQINSSIENTTGRVLVGGADAIERSFRADEKFSVDSAGSADYRRSV